MSNGISYMEILSGFDHGTYVNFVPDEVFWHKASLQNNKISYEGYLRKFPRGFHENEANLRLKEFVRLEQEEIQRLFALDYQAYEHAKTINSIDSYKDYLGKFPQGYYYEEALTTLTTLQDTAAFERARGLNTISSYENYLKDFKKGIYSGEAESNLKRLKDCVDKERQEAEQKKDKEAFEGAKKLNTIYSYRDYLHQFQEGAYRNEAESNLRKLEDIAEKKRIEDKLQEDRENCKLEKERLKKDIRKSVFYLVGIIIVGLIIYILSWSFKKYALIGFLGVFMLISITLALAFFSDIRDRYIFWGLIFLGLTIYQLLAYLYYSSHSDMLALYFILFMGGLLICFIFLAKDIYENVMSYRSWHKKLTLLG